MILVGNQFLTPDDVAMLGHGCGCVSVSTILLSTFKKVSIVTTYIFDKFVGK